MIELSKRQIAKIEKPKWCRFWGARRLSKPKFVHQAFGDGNRLIYLTPLQTRPHYYVLRVDSKWSLDNLDNGELLHDHLDEIYEAIEDEYGWYLDGHSSEYDHSDGEYPGWPVLFNEGCAWGDDDLADYGIRRKEAKRADVERHAETGQI